MNNVYIDEIIYEEIKENKNKDLVLFIEARWPDYKWIFNFDENS